jgi:galactonate dehydratase
VSERIVSIEPVVVDAGTRTWVLVRVTTAGGLVGTGEATLEWRTDVVVAALGQLSEQLVGEDASRIAHHFQRMWRGRAFRAGPAELSAASGIEQALWDIKGQLTGQPVYELLGGACRDHIELYANGVFEGTPEETAASAVEICAAGFRSIKLGCVRWSAPVDGGAVIRHAVDVVDAVRAAVGPDVRIAIDASMRLSPAMAIRLARALENRDLWFLEEPCRMDHPDGLTAVARATSIPIAAGERWLTRWAFVDPLRDRAIALAQPDVAHCGGILEARFIAALAEAHDVGFAPHNPLSPVNTLASAHVALTSPNFVALEYKIAPDAPWRDQLLASPLDIRDGKLYVSSAPGLGSALEPATIEAHPRRPISAPEERLPDGSVTER